MFMKNLSKKLLHTSILSISIIFSILLLASCVASSNSAREGHPKITSPNSLTVGDEGDFYTCWDSEAKQYGNIEEYQAFVDYQTLYYSGGNAGEAPVITNGSEYTKSVDCDIDSSGNATNCTNNSLKLNACPTYALTRPTEEIFISNQCACENGKAISYNQCDTYCEAKANTDATLFVDVTLGTKIALNPVFKDLYGWCSAQLEDGPPKCTLQYYVEESDPKYLDINTLSSGETTFSVNLYSIRSITNKIITARLYESTSKTFSKSFKFSLTPSSSTDVVGGALGRSIVSEYVCVNRAGTVAENSNDIYFSNYTKFHFYFDQASSGLLPLSAGSKYLFCHDINEYANDGEGIPRLQLKANAFSLWSKTDARFYPDTTGTDTSGEMLIHHYIAQKLGKVTLGTKYFQPFSWAMMPKQSSTILGFFMTPFTKNGVAFCPTESDFKYGSATFKAMSEFVGGGTEGIYIGLRQNLPLLNSDGSYQYNADSTVKTAPNDFILVNESVLKKIWFYYNASQQLVIPKTESETKNKQMVFYWPVISGGNPYVKQDAQQLTYYVKSPSELNQILQSTTNSSSDTISNSNTLVNQLASLQQNASNPDKKFGCVPK